MNTPPPEESGLIYWWEDRRFVVAMILLSMVPLLYPPIPPLVDLLGHMGRYRVALDLANSPELQRYWDFRWGLMGNLGVDLLIVPMAKLFGLEFGVKLIVMAIPPLTVGGFLWVAREVHHRIPPTALFALPFVYGNPFLFGFVNFSLSMAFVFLAFGLWLRLGRLGRTGLRLALFVPISFVVFITHAFDWGVLGLLCFSAEAVRQHDLGRKWWQAGIHAAGHAASLALPLLMLILWRQESAGGVNADMFNWKAKQSFINQALRDRWRLFDVASLVVCAIVVGAALFLRRLGFSRNLAFSALVLILIYILLPRIVFGSSYADMRLVPFIMAVILLGIRFRGPTHLPTARVLAAIGLAFVLVRLGSNGISLAIAADDQRAKLVALDHVPTGARVLSFVGSSCGSDWAQFRNSHLGSLVIVRRMGFSNDQWRLPGAQLLTLREPHRWGRFGTDPSEQVNPDECGSWEHWAINKSLVRFPRDQFDYVWLIDPPTYNPALVTDLTEVWRGGNSVLYRVRQ